LILLRSTPAAVSLDASGSPCRSLATAVVDRHQDDAARGKESAIDEDGAVSIAGWLGCHERW